MGAATTCWLLLVMIESWSAERQSRYSTCAAAECALRSGAARSEEAARSMSGQFDGAAHHFEPHLLINLMALPSL